MYSIDANISRYCIEPITGITEATGSIAYSVFSGTNIGSGVNTFAGKQVRNLLFKSLVAGSNVSLVDSSTGITINGTGTGVSLTTFNSFTGTNATNIASKLSISNFNSYSGATSTSINNKLSNSNFQTFTGTTLPASYLKIVNFNSYSGSTNTLIGTKLSSSNFQTYTGTTVPATFLRISNFNSYSGTTSTSINSKLSNSSFQTYTGTTLPVTYLKISNFNSYSGVTNTLIGTKVSTTNFNTYTGTTAPASYIAKNITANRQTGSYTLVLSDAGKLVEMNVASANNLTVPPNSSVAFPIGTQILLSQYGVGQTSIVAGGGVTIRSASGNLKLYLQYSGASLVKIGTDEWYLFGDLTA
jgi:hypothetical protein